MERGLQLWVHGGLLFVGEFAGVCAFLLAFASWAPSPNSRCRILAINPVPIVIASLLFVGSCVSWTIVARVSDPRAASRGPAILIARFASELVLLCALAPAVVCARLIEGSWGLAASTACLCAFAYVSLGLSFVPQVAAFEGSSVVASMRRSWSLASGRRLRLLVHRVSLWVLVVLGACTCVGLLAVGPLVNAARVESYLALTRERDRAAPPA